MKAVHEKSIIRVATAIILCFWLLLCICFFIWIAERVGYEVFQSSIRFVGIAIAAGMALSGYLYNSLKDLRKQLKDESSILSRREVANLNYLITKGQSKAILITLLYLLTGIFFGSASFWMAESIMFLWLVSFAAILSGFCIAASISVCANLLEVARFEEKLSNRIKMKTSATFAAKAFKNPEFKEKS